MIGAIAQAGMGLVQLGGSMVGGRKRREEEAAAQREYDMRRSQYEALDTSNPYANMQNTMEDLTINQQQSQFAAEQQQQALANTMSGMQMAAGGSGIAALAQSMANQQSMNLQRASADIGAQESRNQMAAAQQASQIQNMERQGEMISRQAQKEKTETLFGMAQGRLGAAKDAREQARSSAMEGAFNTVVGTGLAVEELAMAGVIGGGQ